MNVISVLYLLIKASRNNLNWAILALVIRLPLNIFIILIRLFLSLTLYWWVLLDLLCKDTLPNPRLFFIKNSTWQSVVDCVTLKVK